MNTHCFLFSIHFEFQKPVCANRRFVLRNLIALRQIGIEIIFAGKLVSERDFVAEYLFEDVAARIGSDAIGLDWTIDIGEARRRVGDRVALQGNLDPGVLFAPPETIAAEARGVLTSYGAGGTGHVFNLGHGISQFTPPESVAALVDAVHMMSRVKAGNDA